MDFAFAIHALATLCLTHQLRKTVLENACANSGQHVIPAVFFQYDRVYPPQMQELRQQQARRSAADDAYLDFHALLPPICCLDAVYRWR